MTRPRATGVSFGVLRKPRAHRFALVFALASTATLLRVGSGVRAAAPTSTVVSGWAPPGGGLSAVAAQLDVGARRLSIKACTAMPCDAVGGEATPIPLADPIDLAKSSITVVEVGAGRRLLHVVARSSSRPNIAWEALVAGKPSGGATVVWSGGTGFDAQGEGVGARVSIDGQAITLGELRRELTICGQGESLLSPRHLDPKTMTLKAIAMPRLSKKARESAVAIAGTTAKEAPIGSVLGLHGASTNDGGSASLVDEDPSTSWIEARRGDGRGEFVVFSAPKNLPLQRLSLVVTPTKPIDGFAQPTSIYVVVDDATYVVTLPIEATPGARVDVVFPTPRATSCVAIELDRASVASADDPSVGLAEVDGVPVIPKTVHALDDLVTLLDGSGDTVDLSMTLLSHAGARGAQSLIAKLAAVGDAGRERAVEVLEATPCSAAAPGLVRLSWDAPKSTQQAARSALDSCGVEAKGAIAQAFADGPAVVREALAERYARLDPKGALEAILAIVPTSPSPRRRTYRLALARVSSTSSGREAIAAWLTAHAEIKPGIPSSGYASYSTEADATIELARAIASTSGLEEALPLGGNLVAQLSRVLLPRAGKEQPFDRRWLAAEPLAALAARGDAPSLSWLRALSSDGDRYLRMRAAQVSAKIEALRPELLHALEDVDPRVRQSALAALRDGGGGVGAAVPTMTLLKGDAWTFVRVSAAELLAELKGGNDVDAALAAATHDQAKSVRAASIRALAARGAHGHLGEIRARAFDEEEAVDVRRDAVEALGTLCDRASADELYELAKRVGESDAARSLALAAIVALGEVHPKDLAARLGALDHSEPVVKDAIDRALRTTGRCP